MKVLGQVFFRSHGVDAVGVVVGCLLERFCWFVWFHWSMVQTGRGVAVSEKAEFAGRRVACFDFFAVESGFVARVADLADGN